MGFLKRTLSEVLSLYIPSPVPLVELYLLPRVPSKDSRSPEASSAIDQVLYLWLLRLVCFS